MSDTTCIHGGLPAGRDASQDVAVMIEACCLRRAVDNVKMEAAITKAIAQLRPSHPRMGPVGGSIAMTASATKTSIAASNVRTGLYRYAFLHASSLLLRCG
jgi:hypothetical protein